MPLQLATLISTGILSKTHVFYELVHRFVNISCGEYPLYASYTSHRVLRSYLETMSHFVGPHAIKLLGGEGAPYAATLSPQERVSLFNVVHCSPRVKEDVSTSAQVNMRMGGWQYVHQAAFLQLARQCFSNDPRLLVCWLLNRCQRYAAASKGRTRCTALKGS